MKNTKMQGFAGFPAGKLPTTTLPSLFFSELLPVIDNLAELKVTLHLIWLIGRKRGSLRYARLSELMSDQRLLDGLATKNATGETILRDALERATARGTVLHAVVYRGEVIEDWYLINGPNGRQVVEKLRLGELDVTADVAEDIQLQVERPNIFVLYEQNIGLLQPMIAEELREAEQQYPPDWIVEAFHEAVALNKRNWRYVLRILERWRAEGKGSSSVSVEGPRDSEARRRHYVPKGYEDLIEH